MRKAIELDPLSVGVNGGYGAVLIYARQYDAAIAQLAKTAQMDPAFARAHTELAKAYLMKGARDREVSRASLSGHEGVGRRMFIYSDPSAVLSIAAAQVS